MSLLNSQSVYINNDAALTAIHDSQRRVHASDCVECADNVEGYVHRIERNVTLDGNLTPDQHVRLQEIAGKCPVHKTLTSAIIVVDKEAPETKSALEGLP